MLNIPITKEAEQVLRQAWGDHLERTALEALVIEGYRSRKFGISIVRRVLGLPSRWDAEAWLGERGLNVNYALQDLEADRQTLAHALDKDT